MAFALASEKQILEREKFKVQGDDLIVNCLGYEK